MNYAYKIRSIENQIEELEVLKKSFERRQEEARSKEGMDRWIDYPFTSSSVRTPEFKSFEKDFIEELKKQVGNEFKPYGFGGSHFYVSGFLKNKKTGKIVYISVSDVRFFPNGWYEDVLIRTAKDEKDYTGGRNNSCNFYEIYEKAKELTE